MSGAEYELTQWSDRLEPVLADCAHLSRHHIVQETNSTQDTARQIDAQPGTVVIAGSQTAGRGRYGRRWFGDPEHGLAMSIVLPWSDAPRVAIACAIGVVDGVRGVCGESVKFGIKWPNDVLADCHGQWKKVSGILVEQAGDRAIIGVGINVGQQQWPNELKGRAVSLRQLDCHASRIEVLEQVLPAIDKALSLDHEQLRRRFDGLDTLTGATIQLRCGDREHTGTVLSVDPLDGLKLSPSDGSDPIWCPAESTTLAS